MNIIFLIWLNQLTINDLILTLEISRFPPGKPYNHYEICNSSECPRLYKTIIKYSLGSYGHSDVGEMIRL